MCGIRTRFLVSLENGRQTFFDHCWGRPTSPTLTNATRERPVRFREVHWPSLGQSAKDPIQPDDNSPTPCACAQTPGIVHGSNCVGYTSHPNAAPCSPASVESREIASW